ncbi:LPXTG cell wall anchor domain-containing protein, partial [Brochothrix thermosphacta]
TEQPSTEQPSTEQPSTEQPSTEQPSTEEPSTEQPSTEQPSTEQPSTEEPSTNHNTTVVDSAGTGESVVNVATPKLPATGEKSNMPLTFLIGAALIVLAFRQLANNNSQSKH